MGDNPSLQHYYLKIMVRICPDKNDCSEYRAYYACIATTAIITRCNAVVRGEALPSIHAMSRLLVTTFKGETARNTCTQPPSAFKYHAAKTARS